MHATSVGEGEVLFECGCGKSFIGKGRVEWGLGVTEGCTSLQHISFFAISAGALAHWHIGKMQLSLDNTCTTGHLGLSKAPL